MAAAKRPLSPHLQIYKPQLTSTMSIAHRGTGALLCAGAMWITLGLICLADQADSWDTFRAYSVAWYGKLIIGGFVLALVYHWLNGLRHLFWDAGKGLNIQDTYRSGKLLLVLFVLISAALIGCATWGAA